MGSIFLDMAMSLDGFICGPNGEDAGLHDWYFATPGAAVEVVDELLHTIGAIVMGKQAFGDAPDGFDTPYKVPHFIVTHASLPTISRDGATLPLLRRASKVRWYRPRQQLVAKMCVSRVGPLLLNNASTLACSMNSRFILCRYSLAGVNACSTALVIHQSN